MARAGQPYTAPVRVTGDGESRVDFRARDAAGNSTGARSVPVRIDATPPRTVLDVRTGSARATLGLSASDATSGVEGTRARIDGGPWREVPDGGLTVTGFGDHVVEFFSSDVAGNDETLQRSTFTLSDVADAGALAPPRVSGRPSIGSTLRSTTGTWNTSGLRFERQWLRGGRAIRGATGATYRPVRADLGSRLSVRVTAAKAGLEPGSATSAATAKVRKAASTVRFSTSRPSVRQGQRSPLAVHVVSPVRPTGTVILRLDGRKLRVVRASGATVRLSILVRGRGLHRLRAVYGGSPTVAGAASGVVRIRVR